MFQFLVLAISAVAAASAQFVVPYSSINLGVYPYYGYSALPAVAPVVPRLPISSQYHAQNELGEFSFGHASDLQRRDEVKLLDGTTRGSYSYLDPTGKVNHVEYLADNNGFRVLGANNLPVAPSAPVVPAIEPIKDTAEVVAARSAFLEKFKEAEEAAKKAPEEAKSRRRRDILKVPIATFKTIELKPVDGALTPAATKKADINEVEHKIEATVHRWSSWSPYIALPITHSNYWYF